ncbi:sulfite exporter TauE/SafE family protein [Aurantivibrio plasticivorans]
MFLDITPLGLLLACITVFVGALVQTSIGFGFAIVSAPLLFLIDVRFVPGAVMIATIVNSAFNVFYFRASLSIQSLVPALVARIPGTMCGAFLLWWVPLEALAILIAVAIGSAIAASFLRLPLTPTPANLAIAGFLSGVMGTATSIGGPPLAILMQGQEANHIRSQLAAFFSISALLSLFVLGVSGQMPATHWLISLPLIIPVLLGGWLGVRVGPLLPAQHLRSVSLAVCSLAVVFMLWRTLSP